jgi:hypothetical protein
MIQSVMVSMIPIVGVPVSSDTTEEAVISFLHDKSYMLHP